MSKAAEEVMRQVGAVPYEVVGSGVRYLLVTSSRGRWIFPKGNVDTKESGAEAARREAFEEAGVEGKIGKSPLICFPSFIERDGERSPTEVCLFALKVKKEHEKWPEIGQRQRRWADLKELKKLVEEPELVEAAKLIARSSH